MEWNNVLELIQKGSSPNIHFAKHVEDEKTLGPIITSMANNFGGGQIIIGIDLINYHLRGSSLSIDQIFRLIETCCEPKLKVKIDFLKKNDKDILFINIPEGDKKPYKFLNNCYIREKNNTRSATLDEEQKLQEFSKKVILIDNNFEEEIASEISLVAYSDHVNLPLEEDNIIEESITEEATIIESPKIKSDLKINKRQQKVLRFLKTHESIKNKKYRSLYSVSHKTAHLELVDLVANNLLKSQGQGRNTCYVRTQEQALF